MILSVVGVFKTILILIGLFVLFRFIGQLMIAKRNIDEQQRLDKEKKNFQKEKELKKKYEGKIFISNKRNVNVQDVDYEDVT